MVVGRKWNPKKGKSKQVEVSEALNAMLAGSDKYSVQSSEKAEVEQIANKLKLQGFAIVPAIKDGKTFAYAYRFTVGTEVNEALSLVDALLKAKESQ